MDISDQFQRKLDAVACYKSQFDSTPESKQIFVPGIDVFEFLKVQDRNYGMQIRREYAEPYVVLEAIELVNPMEMSVASI